MTETAAADPYRAHKLRKAGYLILDNFLTPQECEALLSQIAHYREHHPVPEIHRPMKPRPLRYQVIDGERIREHLPSIWRLYAGRVQQAVVHGDDAAFAPLANVHAGVNVNIMQPKGSSYRWHYDRTRLSCILYLNTVEGGETEMYPNYRIRVGAAGSLPFQRAFDSLIQSPPVRRLFGRKVLIPPVAGRLLIMRGDRCWHSVRPILGYQERINIILAYDRPGAKFPVDEALDAYLYSQQVSRSADPNYG